MASGLWCAAVFPWPEKKGTTGICFLGENALLEPVTGRRKDEPRYSLKGDCFSFPLCGDFRFFFKFYLFWCVFICGE